jgi:hypothetical protein
VRYFSPILGKISEKHLTDTSGIENSPDPNDEWTRRFLVEATKVSAPLGGNIALHNGNGCSGFPIADEREDGTNGISTDSITTKITPAFEDSPKTEFQLYPQVIDTDGD